MINNSDQFAARGDAWNNRMQDGPPRKAGVSRRQLELGGIAIVKLRAKPPAPPRRQSLREYQMNGRLADMAALGCLKGKNDGPPVYVGECDLRAALKR